MENERRFERVPCNEKVIVHYNDIFMEARLLNISVNGALVHLNDEISLKIDDKCLITICLSALDKTLHFLAEVRHCQKQEVGIKFLFLDSDTKGYLNRLLAFRSANPRRISEEFHYPSHLSGDGDH